MAHRVRRHPLLPGVKREKHASPFSNAAALPSVFNRYMGGLKERSARVEHEKDPTSVLRKAVLRMLPKTNLQKVSPPPFLLPASFPRPSLSTSCCQHRRKLWGIVCRQLKA